MPTLSTRVSDELKAITEYAHASGLLVSDLMKKVLIHKICWLGIGNDEDGILQKCIVLILREFEY